MAKPSIEGSNERWQEGQVNLELCSCRKLETLACIDNDVNLTLIAWCWMVGSSRKREISLTYLYKGLAGC